MYFVSFSQHGYLLLFQAMRVENLELLFIRLLHLLAHHPDFAKTQDELMDTARWVVQNNKCLTCN